MINFECKGMTKFRPKQIFYLLISQFCCDMRFFLRQIRLYVLDFVMRT